MIFSPAALPLSRQTLTYVTGIIRRHRAQIGSPWRKLPPLRQALLVLAYMRTRAGCPRCGPRSGQFWHSMFEIGKITEDQLHALSAQLFRGMPGRRYWSIAGSFQNPTT